MSVFSIFKKGAGHFLILTLVVFLLSSCATIQTLTKSESESNQTFKSVYTYDGEFDPIVFFDWQTISSWPHKDHFHALIRNPDINSDVPMVEMVLVKLEDNPYGKHRIMAYRYLKDEIEYVFYLDEKGHYEQLEPSKSKRI